MSFYEKLLTAEKLGIGCALCTIINSSGTTPRAIGSKMIVYENGDSYGSIGGGSVEKEIKDKAFFAINSNRYYKEIFKIDKESQQNIDNIEVFIEPILPQVNLFIFGAGHIGKKVAFFGKQLGWHIVLIDDRTELCNIKIVPEADEFIDSISNKKFDDINVKSSYFVLVTRNSEIDSSILKKIIKKKYRYIGVLGSAKRWEETKHELMNCGFLEDEVNKIHAPIGIDIKAETPEEIAISIISQIIMVRNQE